MIPTQGAKQKGGMEDPALEPLNALLDYLTL